MKVTAGDAPFGDTPARVSQSGASPKAPLNIPPFDRGAQEQALARWNNLTKPQGSLGRLEELAAQLAGMRAQPVPSMQRKLIFTVAADHGVAAEGVSAYPQSVTAQMVENFLRGAAAINVLARQVGAEVLVVDAGVVGLAGEGDSPSGTVPISCAVRRGTGNMVREPAMSMEEAERVIETGRRLFERAQAVRPLDAVGLGEMGIGNTTAASALVSAFAGVPPGEVTGRGTGLSEEGIARKVKVIEKALQLHRPDPADPIGCLAKIGGLEIGCLAGIALAAAEHRVPVFLDGFISSTAGLLAARICPPVREFLIASHRSVEPGHRKVLEMLELEPLLDLQMRLGEGTGAALGLFLAEAAVRLLKEMATFQEAGVAQREGLAGVG